VLYFCINENVFVLTRFASSIELIPELGLGVVVLTNNVDMDAHILTAPIVQLSIPCLVAALDLGIPKATYPVPVSSFFGTWTGQTSLTVIAHNQDTVKGHPCWKFMFKKRL
jgi:hypothetical protein